MVMHARKIPRINDGYYEKQGQTHNPYHNSNRHEMQNSKFSKSNYADHHNDKVKDSPDSCKSESRSGSPDSHSTSPGSSREHTYFNKGSYSHRIRDKEREKESSHSPMERKRHESKSNHDRPFPDKKEDKILRIGDWSEHTSSSGKKYYYNCKTEVSQWEKPREWLDWENKKSRERDRERDKRDRLPVIRKGDKHSNGCTPAQAVLFDNRPTDKRDHKKHNHESNSEIQNSSTNSTPTSEQSSYNHVSNDSSLHCQHPPSLLNIVTSIPSVVSLTPSKLNNSLCSYPPMSASTHHQETPVVVSSLPNSTVTSVPSTSVAGVHNNCGYRPLSGVCAGVSSRPHTDGFTHEALLTLHQVLLLTRHSCKDIKNLSNQSNQSVQSNNLAPLVIQTGPYSDNNGGPPTPTQENMDVDSRKCVSPTLSNLSSLQRLTQSSSALAALRPQVPTLTPSLANYFKEELVTHISNWPAHMIEKQAQRCAEDAFNVGSLLCTKVSTELKIARSVVRLTEIQATLQEQRILFLRQQIQELEDVQSQNSFMFDS